MSKFDRLMVDHSELMMLLVDPATLRIVAANRAASQTLGYGETELLARAISDVESSLQDVFYWEEARNGQCQEIKAQDGLYLCADGSTLEVRKSVRVVAAEGRPLLLIQARNMRDELKSEDELAHTLSQLRATLESTGNGILVLDWQGRIVNMSHLFSKLWMIPDSLLLGYDDAAVLDFILAAVIDGEPLRQRLREIVDRKQTKEILDLRDGRTFECCSRPQYLGDNVVGRVFSFDDITERKRAEQALRDSRDELDAKVRERTADLQAANAALREERARQEELINKLADAHTQLLQSEKMASIGQLAAGVAHEINNPVGFVSSNLGSLQRYVDDLLRVILAYEQGETELTDKTRTAIAGVKDRVDLPYLRNDIRQLLDESSEGVQRVRQIVQDLKTFSHPDATEMEYADLEAGLDSTLNVVWNELKYKAEVVKEYGHVPPVRCIPSQINQVFMNLLVNAAQAIADHGRITLRTGCDADLVWVEVADTGAGIKPEHLGRIFDPFFTTKPVGKGTGLGLSLSYQIMQKHGGRVVVQSEVGKGSVFRVEIPRDKADAATPTAQSDGAVRSLAYGSCLT
jgi:two-component system NtrC family sensor kinase